MSGASCNGCGDCCRVIFASWTKKEVADSPDAIESNRKWARDKLHRISRAEAERRLPAMKLDVRMSKDVKFYRCDNFDEERGLCKVHGTPDKPACCTGFPWYGKPPDADRWTLQVFPQCSFQADLIPTFILGLA